MKRSHIVSKLIKEGFSEKTLLMFSDKQLSVLHNRMVNENTKMIPKEKVPEIEMAKKNKETFVAYESELVGGQEKLDKNKNRKLDSQDFKILRGKKSKVKGEKPSKGSTKKNKEKTEIKEWVYDLAENRFHSMTSKGEIVNMIKNKLHEQEFGEKVKKGHNNVPEFMTYDAIVGGGKEVETPVKPKTTPERKTPLRQSPYRPGPFEKTKPKADLGETKEVETPVKPKTTPERKTPLRQSPYRPGPFEKTKPKAGIAENKNKSFQNKKDDKTNK